MKRFLLFLVSLVFLSFQASVASEIKTKVVLVDDLRSVQHQDIFSLGNLKSDRNNWISAEVRTGGGCADHEYTLYVSKQIRESFPPQVMSKLVLNKNGDACKAIVEGDVVFDLSALNLAGAHRVNVDASGIANSILVNFVDPAKATPNKQGRTINIGTPTKDGDGGLTVNSVSVVSGIDRYWLKVEVSYSGGCAEHQFDMWWDGQWRKSIPPQAPMLLVYDNGGDTCRMLVSETLYYDLDDLVKAQPEFLLTFSVRDGGTHSVSVP